MSTPNHVMVIDPLNFGGLLKVPLSKTFETKGRNDWLKGILKKDLSLCCLFQRGKCHAGSKCHQVHADRNFVADMRAQCSNIKSCCLRCGDTASTYPAGRTMFADLRSAGCTTINVQGSLYPLDFLAYTVGVAGYLSSAPRTQTFISNESLVIPALKVCRLHLRAGCKYGKDCKNIHLCSQLGEAVLKLCNRAMECDYPAPQYHAHGAPLTVDGPMVPYRFVPPSPATAVPALANTPPPPAPFTPQTSTTYASTAYPTPIASAESSFNQESINIPVVHHVNFARSSFGDDLEEDNAPKYDDLSFELKIVSEKKSNFLFRWSHPANASPLPTCLASQSMRNACH